MGGLTHPINNNANSLYDLLCVHLKIDLDVAGSYCWLATLHNEFNMEIEFDYRNNVLVAGSNTIYMSFGRILIAKNFVESPYDISNFIHFGGSLPDSSLMLGLNSFLSDVLLWIQFEHKMNHPSNPLRGTCIDGKSHHQSHSQSL